MAAERRVASAVEMPRPGAPPTPVVPRPERFVLENGLRVALVHRPDFPQLATRLVIHAGAAADPVRAPGAASLVGSLLTEGSHRFSALELNRRIDALGAGLCARVGHDFTEIDLRLLAETLPEGLDLLAEVVMRPSFPARELERVRAEALDALEARLDEPANVADDIASRAVFGESHPYGRLPIGTSEGVQAIGRDDLICFHAEHYSPLASVLVMAGDFDRRLVREQLEETLGAWRAGETDPPAVPHLHGAVAAGTIVSLERADAAQSEIRFAGIGLPRSSARWIPATVANYILGGSTITGRLGANLREDKGWTYGVRSSFAGGVQAAGWVVETAVGAESTAAAIEEITREIERLVDEPVSAEELTRAREAMILSLPRAFETPARIVARISTLDAFGLPEDYWEAFPSRVEEVTADDIQAIARDLFAPAGLVRVAVGPAATPA